MNGWNRLQISQFGDPRPWMRMKMGLPIRMRIGSSSEFACLPAATCCRCCTLMKFVSITTFMPVACQVRFCFSTWFWFSALRAVSCVICITIQISAHVYEAFMMRLFHFGQYLDLTIETNSMVKANKYKYIHYNIEGCDEIEIFCSFAGSKFINPSSIPSYPAIILKDRSPYNSHLRTPTSTFVTRRVSSTIQLQHKGCVNQSFFCSQCLSSTHLIAIFNISIYVFFGMRKGVLGGGGGKDKTKLGKHLAKRWCVSG